MRLISVTNLGTGYQIKAQTVRKIFGIRYYVKNRTFFFPRNNSGLWVEEGRSKEVPLRRQLQLNKWLNEHLKFKLKQQVTG